MSYHLRDRIPRDYTAMHVGQHVDDDQDEFHDSFQYQQPPALVLPSTSQVQPSNTPFLGTQTNTSAPNEDVAALTAEIARVRAENEALERETEVARLKAELVTLQQRNARLQKQKQPSSNPTIKTLRASPALTAHVSEELVRLGFSSSSLDEEENPPTRGSRGKPRLKSGKTTKLYMQGAHHGSHVNFSSVIFYVFLALLCFFDIQNGSSNIASVEWMLHGFCERG